MGSSFIDRERALLRDIVPLVAWRGSEEASIAVAEKQARDQAAREHRAVLLEAQGKAEALRQAAKTDDQSLWAQLNAKHEDELAKLEEARDREIDAFVRQTDAMEASAHKEYEEHQWLAETLVESGEAAANTEHDLSMKELRQRAADVEGIRTRAQELLRQHKHSPLPPGPQAADVSSTDAATIRQRMDDARSELRARLTALEQAISPALGRPSTVIIVAFLASVGGAAIWATWLGRPGAGGIALGLGVGAVVGLSAMLTLRAMFRRRVPAASAGLAASLAESAAAIRAGERYADIQREQRRAEARERRDRELVNAAKARAKALQAVELRRGQDEPELRHRHESAIAELRAKHEAESTRLARKQTERLAGIESTRSARVRAADQQRDAMMASALATSEARRQALAHRWHAGIAQAYAQAAELARVASESERPWSEAYRPAESVPPAVSIGRFRVSFESMQGGLPIDESLRAAGPDAITLPAALDVAGVGSLLLLTPPEARASAQAILQNTMLRLLTAFPPAKLRFTLLDPVALGQTFAGFMHLADHDASLVSDRVWTESRHIEQKLADLTEHMENVIQKYLRNEFPSIQAYNERAGEVAEPYRYLVIADFPANFSEASAKRLASIVASGPRCGVFTIILADTRHRPPAWAPMAELERASLTLSWMQGRWVCLDPDLSPWPLTLDGPPDDARLTEIVHEVGRLAKDAGRVQVPFEVVAPPAGREWTGDASRELRVALGRAGATKLQELALGLGTSQHALVAGRTGSGKSTLLHTLITNLALWYSPDEVEFYLVDFKKGVEFKTYATHAVPHARVIAVESEREFGLSVLRRLDAELSRRGELYRALGVQDLAGFRRHERGGPLPRTLLIVDEFQEFFTSDDKLAQEAMLLLDRLVRQGRAFGMHVILGSQTIGGAYSLARSTIGQIAVRIALQCSEADSYLILSDDNPAARLLSRPGEAIYNDASGMIEGNSPFQVVWLPDDVREAKLRAVRDRAENAAGATRPPAIVFEGNVPSDLARNIELAERLAGRRGPAREPKAWLGEAISIKEPTAAVFRRQASSNLLIVGQQEYLGDGVMTAIMLGLASGVGTPDADATTPITLLEGATGEEPGPMSRIADALPGLVKLAGLRSADAAIASLYDEVERRRTSDRADWPSRFLIVNHLQRFRSLRKSDEFGFGSSDADAPLAKPDEQLGVILREGPMVGVHTIIRADTAASVERAFDRRLMREMDLRLLFQVSGSDSSSLIDSPAASTLGAHRALLYSEEAGTFEKFRPYAPPSATWLTDALAALSGASASASRAVGS